MHSAAVVATRISHAHLFGSEKAAPEVPNPTSAAETQLNLALTGTLATRDPNDGYAILGEKGKASHLYHTGVALGDGLSGRLYQTFTDRVVLEMDGHLETLRLPRQITPGLISAPVAAPEATAVAGPVASLGIDPAGRTAAEAWFELLHPQHQLRGNQAVGIKLRPDMRLQRQYDLRYNDVLTAIDGVDISGPDSLDNLQDALKGAGKSLSLTVMRDGVQQVLTVPVTDGR
jgi:general secretion pathway protein C